MNKADLEKIKQLFINNKLEAGIELLKSIYPTLDQDQELQSKILKTFGYSMLFNSEMPKSIENTIENWSDSNDGDWEALKEIWKEFISTDEINCILYKIVSSSTSGADRISQIFHTEYSGSYFGESDKYGIIQSMPYEVSGLCESMADTIYLISPEMAKIFYQMSCWFIETYWDLLWLINTIIIKYQDIDSEFVVDCGKGYYIKRHVDKDGWNLMPGDDDDAPVLGENWDGNVHTEEEYDDLEYDINIRNFQNLSDLLYEIQKRMAQ